MDCVNNCEFIDFSDGDFWCAYYDKPLSFVGAPKISIQRCQECMSEGIIGINRTVEDVRKIKKYVSWLADSFYSHKDEFESNLTEIYRLLKGMENEEN